jgi:predicted dehydrogenase
MEDIRRGALMRLGAHPVGGVLHLKHFEGMLKYGKPIQAKSVTAEVGQHTKIASFTKEKKKYVVSEWEDVEDWGVMVINFEDGSKATVFSSDAVLGGVRNTMNVYLSNAVVNVTSTLTIPWRYMPRKLTFSAMSTLQKNWRRRPDGIFRVLMRIG